MIQALINKPHRYLFICVTLSLVLLLFVGDSMLDIQLHDTYLVLGMNHVLMLFVIVFAILGAIYYGLRKAHLVPWMTILHVALSIGFFVFIALF